MPVVSVRWLLAGVVALLTATMALVWTQRVEVLPDFASMPVSEKKAEFFQLLGPEVRRENERLAALRGELVDMQAALDAGLSSGQQSRLEELGHIYLPDDADLQAMSDADKLEELLLRVGRIPRSLVLIQAAKESGWGTSRFARLCNNLFGQQCFEEGCGFTPKKRNEGLQHEVARFHSVSEAIEAYMHNLNTHYRYETFRQLRAAQRRAGVRLSGIALADGLEAYSERGMAYVQEIKSMIRQNDLE